MCIIWIHIFFVWSSTLYYWFETLHVIVCCAIGHPDGKPTQYHKLSSFRLQVFFFYKFFHIKWKSIKGPYYYANNHKSYKSLGPILQSQLDISKIEIYYSYLTRT